MANDKIQMLDTLLPLKFCLNLDRRMDRKLQAWAQFRREGLEVERLAAPDAVEMGIEERRGFRGVGPRACAAAHRLAWREARRRGAPAVLIFEDDVVLAEDFREKLERWLRIVPNDWAMLYLGCVFIDPPEEIAPGLLRVTGRTWDMHACAVKTRRLPDLHRAVRPLGFRRAGDTRDEALDTVVPHLHPSFPVYAPWPPLAWQVWGISNNEVGFRSNYGPDGRQNIWRDAIAHLPP